MILMNDIIREGHPTLRQRSEEVTFPLSDEDKQLAHDLHEYVVNSQNDILADQYELRAGIGLAAPQVNQPKRMFALHIESDSEKGISIVAINPKIVSHSVEQTYLSTGEGCLSVDREVEGYVPRHARITVKAFNTEGKEFKKRLKGLPAIAFQHELDHLNGIMFYDHIDPNEPYKTIEGADPYVQE